MVALQAGDIELWDEEMDRWIPLMLVNQWDSEAESIRPKIVVEQLFASEEGSDIAKRLLPRVQEDWTRGMGLDYDWAPGLYCRSPGYVTMAGQAIEEAVPDPLAGSIIAFEEFLDEQYCIQSGDIGAGKPGRVLRFDTGTDAWVTVFTAPAGQVMRGLVAADTTGSGSFLYAMSSDGGVQNGMIHVYDGLGWTSTAAGAFGTNGRSVAKVVYWTTSDGLGASRLVTFSSLRKVSYTKPFGDPMDPLAWVEGVVIGGSRGSLLDIAASGTHAFISAHDGLFDLDELGNSPNRIPYVRDMVSAYNGYAVQYLDGAVYYGLQTSIDRVIVEQELMAQEIPGICGPNWMTPSDNPVVGWCSAMTVDQGWLVAAIVNQVDRKAYICYGKSAKSMNIESPNPLIWHGPEVVIEDCVPLAMHVSSLGVNQRWLWVGGRTDSNSQGVTFRVSVPFAGTPMQTIGYLGNHKFTDGSNTRAQPFSRLYSLPDTYEDMPSLKIIHEHAVGTIGLPASDGAVVPGTSPYLIEYDRADPEPGSTDWGSGTEILTGPSKKILPGSPVKGYELGRRIDFFAPEGAAATPKVPFLKSVRTTAWKVAPSFQVRAVTVHNGTGVVDRNLGRSTAWNNPEEVVARILAIIEEGGLTVIRDTRGRRKNVRIQQMLEAAHIYLPQPPGQAMEIKLEIVVLSDAA